MKYKKLGNTDLNVSTICLGTMTWGEQNTQDEGFEQMDYALDQGVNFWDTAEIYSIPPREETFGSTEKIIGNWFKKTKKRDKVILASKVCGPMREYVRGGGNQFGKKNITEALEGSLKRLKTDYIDLYQLHWPERNTNFFGKLGYEHRDDNEWTKFEDILENLKKFIDEGKKNLISVPIFNGTIPHEQESTYGGARVFMKPASSGTGVIAGGAMRAVLESAGVKNVLAKSKGSPNPHNVVKATLLALSELRDPMTIAQTRGVKLENVFNG